MPIFMDAFQIARGRQWSEGWFQHPWEDTGCGEAEATVGQAEGLDKKSALRGVDEGGDLRSQWKQFNRSQSVHRENE